MATLPANTLWEMLSELKARLRELYGERLVKMYLYGSQARGDARPWSDVDVLLVLQGPVNVGQEINRTSEINGDLSLRYDTVISRVFVDPERFQSDDFGLIPNVRKEGIEF